MEYDQNRIVGYRSEKRPTVGYSEFYPMFNG